MVGDIIQKVRGAREKIEAIAEFVWSCGKDLMIYEYQS